MDLRTDKLIMNLQMEGGWMCLGMERRIWRWREGCVWEWRGEFRNGRINGWMNAFGTGWMDAFGNEEITLGMDGMNK